MGGDSIANLIYGLILLLAIGGSVMTLYPGQLRKMALHFTIWVGLIGALVLGYENKYLFEGWLIPAPQSVDHVGNVTLLRGQDGHFQVTALLNDVPVEFVVDTGASLIVLSKQDAQRIGFRQDALVFDGRASTANGPVRFASVMLDSFRIGDAVDLNVSASVNEGELRESLLGMSYLNRFSRITIQDDRMILER